MNEFQQIFTQTPQRKSSGRVKAVKYKTIIFEDQMCQNITL